MHLGFFLTAVRSSEPQVKIWICELHLKTELQVEILWPKVQVKYLINKIELQLKILEPQTTTLAGIVKRMTFVTAHSSAYNWPPL